MSPMLAYLGSDPERLGCWLGALDRELAGAAPASEAWGVGYYQDDHPLLIKRPRSGRPWRFGEELRGLASKLVVWHGAPAAAPRGTAASADQPLLYERWLWAGEVERELPAEAREELRRHLPEHLRRRIKGPGAGEHLFFWVLQALQREGWLGREPAQVPALADAVRAAVLDFAEQWLPGGQLGALGAVLTNGRSLIALSRQGELRVAFKEGLADCAACAALLPGDYGLRESHQRARVVLIARGLGPAPAGGGWQALAPDSLLVLERDLSQHHFRWA